MTDVVIISELAGVVVTEAPLAPPDVVFITPPPSLPPAVVIEKDTVPTVVVAESIRGPQGTQGVQGTQGSQGVQGSVGVGAQGPQGTQGQIGPVGPQGVAGVQGPIGSPGGIGAQGPQGPQGAGGTGPQGTQGAVGAQGTPGPQGATGVQGAQGAQGTGAQGVPGAQGPQGNQGPQGPIGQGQQGPVGSQGAQGASGGSGPQGSQGTQGPSGVTTAGTNLQVIYNSAGVLTGTPNMYWDGTYFRAKNVVAVGGGSLFADRTVLTVPDLTTQTGNVVIDAQNQSQTWNLTGAVTITAINNLPLGNIVRLMIGHNRFNITWPSNLYWPLSVAPNVAQGVMARMIVVIERDRFGEYCASASVY